MSNRPSIARGRRSFLKGLAALPAGMRLLASPRQNPDTLVPPGKVKITGFTTHKVSIRWRDLLFLEVHTDAGITGLGEATLDSGTVIAEATLKGLEPEYVGLDASGPEEHWDRVYYKATRWRNGPALMTGLSAVDIALWDIEAKRFGVPLHRLLGGALQNKLRVYHTHWDALVDKEKRSPASFSEQAAKTVKKAGQPSNIP